ncbi:MAG: proline dehydrogenase family protein, partial [Phycisphaeraceae bacterium]
MTIGSLELALRELQGRIEVVGGEMLRRARRAGGGGGGSGGGTMEVLMADERLRVQALRFVDVLPALERDDEALVRHLGEYFLDGELGRVLPVVGRFPWVVGRLRAAVDSERSAKWLAPVVRRSAARLGRRFIAGHDAASVLPRLARLRRKGLDFTLDLLGEATLSEAEAEAYQRQYLRLIEELAGQMQRAGWRGPAGVDVPGGDVRGLGEVRTADPTGARQAAGEGASGGGAPSPGPSLKGGGGQRGVPAGNVSVKLTSLYSQVGPVREDAGVAVLKERLRPILLAARQHGMFINLDMEQYDTKRITLRVFRELLMEPGLRDWRDVGIAMQAYLRDTEDDLDGLVEWARERGTPVTVRLVRGAYWDYETVLAQQHGWDVPVWTEKPATDVCYERCLWKLLRAHEHLDAAVATHNVRSLAVAQATAEAMGLVPGQYELQMLYGMADGLKRAAADMGHRVRVYVPFGELLPGMAYLVRRLLENTSSQSFLRMSVVGGGDARALLAVPVVEAAAGATLADKPPVAPGEADGERAPEPVRRFADERERQAFGDAIVRVRAALGASYGLVIGGERGAAEGGAEILSRNPARPGEVVGRVASASAGDAQRAVAAAAEAFATWAARPAAERAGCLMRAAEVMRGRRDELAAWQVIEAGKPWPEADGDVCEAIDFLCYYAHQMTRLSEGAWLNVPGETNHYHYIPRGVGAVIAPWNFPLAILTGMTAATIVTGNTAVVKPAPQTPVMAAKLMEVLGDERVGLPAGVVNLLPGGDEAGQALVTDPRVALVAFTGSQAAGTWINAEGAKVREGQRHIRRIVAEMGGKNAVIIDADADLDDAVRGTVLSAFNYAGQKCSAASRAIVVGEAYEPFLERAVEAARSLAVGDPRDPAASVGPVIDEEAYGRINGAIEAVVR